MENENKEDLEKKVETNTLDEKQENVQTEQVEQEKAAVDSETYYDDIDYQKKENPFHPRPEQSHVSTSYPRGHLACRLARLPYDPLREYFLRDFG